MPRAAAATPTVSSSSSIAKWRTSGGMRPVSRSNTMLRTRSKAVGESVFMTFLLPSQPSTLIATEVRFFALPAASTVTHRTRSIACGRVYHVLERLTRQPAIEIVAEHVHRPALPPLVDARAMRRDDDVVHGP